MFKKTAIAIAAMMLAVIPAAPAAAWEEICMKTPEWRFWLIHVVYDFPTETGELPATGDVKNRWDDGTHVQPLPREIGVGDQGHAYGRIIGAPEGLATHRCLDIRRIPPGTPFFVYVESPEYSSAHCKTDRSNPYPYNFQQDRPYRTMWFESWGKNSRPSCQFTREAH